MHRWHYGSLEGPGTYLRIQHVLMVISRTATDGKTFRKCTCRLEMLPVSPELAKFRKSYIYGCFAIVKCSFQSLYHPLNVTRSGPVTSTAMNIEEGEYSGIPSASALQHDLTLHD
jgi:hypothetical protein